MKYKVLEKLVKLQNRAIRIMTLSKFRASTDPLFEKHDLLKLIDINLYSYAKFMYSWYHNKLPSVFDNSFTYVHDIHPDIETRQSTNNSMFPPKFSRDYGHNALVICLSGTAIEHIL